MIRRTAGYFAVLLVTVYLFFMYDAPVLSGILVFCFFIRQHPAFILR